MKKTIFQLSALMLMFLLACNKEDPIKPSADFATNIQNNTLVAGQGFVMYLDNVSGEFLTYFRGNTLESTYDSNEPGRRGVTFTPGIDSLVMPGYSTPDTTFIFTLVASSSGNWAKDYVQDIKSISIKIVRP